MDELPQLSIKTFIPYNYTRGVQAHSEYTSRLDRWRAIQKDEDALFRQVGNIRLSVLAVAAGMIWGIAFRHWFSAAWMAIPVAIFIALAVWHESIVGRLRRAARAMRFYERGMARIEDRWAGSGNQGIRFQDPEHLYAGDIDIFGKGSLFELLSTARTTAGEATLAGWLAATSRASADAIRQRQEAVAEQFERTAIEFAGGEEAFDDETVVAIKLKGQAKRK